MRNRLLAIMAVTGALLAASAPVLAHHGAAAYESTKTVTAEGIVTDFEFTNPHVIISMDVKDATGVVQKWQGELTSPNRLAREGWTRNTLKLGDHVVMVGNPAKSGANSVWIRKISLDGKDLSTGGAGN